MCSGSNSSSVWNWRRNERMAAGRVPNLLPCGEGNLLTLADAGQFELWRVGEGKVRQMVWPQGMGRAFFDLGAKRERMLAGANEGTVQTYDLRTMQPLGPEVKLHGPSGQPAVRRMVAWPRLAGDGAAFFTWDGPNAVAVYALSDGQKVPLLR